MNDPFHAQVQMLLLERLEAIRFVPENILDLDTCRGCLAQALWRIYPKARVFCSGLSNPELKTARRIRPHRFSWRRLPTMIARARALPMADESLSLVASQELFSPGRFPHKHSPDQVMTELHRALAPGGLLLFATYGPDTLKELRTLWTQATNREPFDGMLLEMHDLGDALVRAGFKDVVIDVERLTLWRPSVQAIFAELRRFDRPPPLARALVGKQSFQRFEEAYEAHREGCGLPVSVELVFAHAWKDRSSTRATQIPVAFS